MKEQYYIVRLKPNKEVYYKLDQWGRTDWTDDLSKAQMFDTKDAAEKTVYSIYFFTGHKLEVRKTDKLKKAYDRAMGVI